MRFNRSNKLWLHVFIQLLALIIPVGLFLLWGNIAAQREMKREHHGDPFLGIALMCIVIYVCWIIYLLISSMSLHVKRLYALRNANWIIAGAAILIAIVIRYM
ncbi:MAG: hypothetical protein J0I41_22285 [Filimonas sp.]|nr:hypothetical protein [Filimonas sp.]